MPACCFCCGVLRSCDVRNVDWKPGLAQSSGGKVPRFLVLGEASLLHLSCDPVCAHHCKRLQFQSPLVPCVRHPLQVVTDFTTCHNTWFHAGATRCFVPTPFCANLAKSNGLSDPQIVMHGAAPELHLGQDGLVTVIGRLQLSFRISFWASAAGGEQRDSVWVSAFQGSCFLCRHWGHKALGACQPRSVSPLLSPYSAPYNLLLHAAQSPPGLPIRPVFSKHLPGRRSMRRRLGLEPRKPAVLLVRAMQSTVPHMRCAIVLLCNRMDAWSLVPRRWGKNAVVAACTHSVAACLLRH